MQENVCLHKDPTSDIPAAFQEREMDPNTEKYKPLPNHSENRCFGCGPANPSGLRMQFATDGNAVYSWLSVPPHLGGWHNLAHGGVLFTILDEVMGRAIIYSRKSLVMTKSITMDFRKPVPIGREIKTTARLLEIRSDRESIAESFICNETGEVCARATGVFATFPKEVARRLGIADEAMLDWFESYIRT
jgi:uncharacterized protein (TIGR00369 family)